MKKNLLLTISALSISSVAWAATPTLPTLNAYTIEKGLIVYTLTPAEANLVQQLKEQGNMNHVVVVDNKGHILNTLTSGQSAYQLSLTKQHIKSIRLAESYGQTKQLSYLTQPLNLKNLPTNTNKNSIQSREKSYQTPQDIEITTIAATAAGVCGSSATSSCPLYANSNQQIPVFINFNSSQQPTPPSDFNPVDFDNVVFTEGANGPAIPMDGQFHDGIKISRSSNGYDYGQIQQQPSSHAGALVTSVEDSPVNAYYVTFESNTPQRIHTNLALNAYWRVPGSKATINTSASQTSVNITGVPPYTYSFNDFKFNIDGGGTVNDYLAYTIGYIGSTGHGLPGLHDVKYTPFPTQNSLRDSSGNVVYKGETANLAGVAGDNTLFTKTDGEGISPEYTDGPYAHVSVYLNPPATDPSNVAAQALPFYVNFNTMSGQPTVCTQTQFQGTDLYGNPFQGTAYFVLKAGSKTITESANHC